MTLVDKAAGGEEIFFVLLPTLECNLRCTYCFEEHPGGRWDIAATRTVLTAIFTFLAEKGLSASRLHWQGGEPLLMGQAYWQAVLPMAAELAARHGVRLVQSMQTNLTLYDAAFGPLARQFLAGVLGTSFEPAGLRLGVAGGASAFTRQWRRAHEAARADGLEVGVLSLLTEAALRQGAAAYLNELRETHGIRRLRLTLPFRQTGQGFWLDAEAAGDFLAVAYDLWYGRGGDDWLEIRPFEHLTARLRNQVPRSAGLCMFSRNCADISLAILPTGEVTLCDNFAGPGEASSGYGNVFRQSLGEIHAGAGRAAIRRQVAGLLTDQCAACRYLGFCFGGCLARARSTMAGTAGYHYCDTHRRLFRAIEERAVRGG